MKNTDEILASTKNRQYPLPARKWKYFQQWQHTVFLHWEVPVYFLEEYIPEGLELDTFNNSAWISLVAFEVADMRLRNLPPLPYVSNFYEINIRTYVIKDRKPGIYMLSIETDKFVEVLLTRLFIGLPYEKSTITKSANRVVSNNKNKSKLLDINIGKHKPLAEKTTLDYWLTERHSLYEASKNKINRFDIHHKEWDLKNLDVVINDISYQAGKFDLSISPDKMHYAEKLDVLLWAKETA